MHWGRRETPSLIPSDYQEKKREVLATTRSHFELAESYIQVSGETPP